MDFDIKLPQMFEMGNFSSSHLISVRDRLGRTWSFVYSSGASKLAPRLGRELWCPG